MNGPFYISHEGGNSHSFIASLLLHLMTDDTQVIEFSEKGHSHIYTHKFPKIRPDLVSGSTHPNYLAVENFPPRIRFKYITDIEELLNEAPESKLIIIHVAKEDELRIEYNHFYKAYYGLPEKVVYYWDIYKKLRIPGLRRNLNKFNEFTTDELKLLLQAVSNGKHRDRDTELKQYTQLQNRFPNNIFILPYSDIITNSEKTLKLINNVAGKPIPNVLRESYNQYIILQDKFAERYMPWLPK